MQKLTQCLLEWYSTHKRDLPWRRSSPPDPYAVWLVEIMGQQTRIAQMLPYYERFRARFRDVHALADAPLDDVLKAWEGLGYYSRARNLHAAAQVIARDGFPQNAADWLRLPGVGAYTAAAIAAVARGEPVAAVDGNVLRVYARLHNDAADIRKAATVQAARAFALQYMPADADAVREYTQALMELGALVCTPKKPHCPICPLQADCRAHALGTQAELPYKSPPSARKHVPMLVLLLYDAHGAILMRRRTERLLNGLWVFHLAEGEFSPEAAREHAADLGYTVDDIRDLGQTRHAFTHITWHMQGYAVYAQGPAHADYVFVPQAAFDGLAVPTALQYYKKSIFAASGVE